MPTGYTYQVADGTVTSFRDFALSMARGMGALVTMRDDPADAPIPKSFEPESYHTKRLKEAQDELGKLYAMSHQEMTDKAQAEYNEDVAADLESAAKDRQTRLNYENMLQKARDWKGSPEGIKKFMIEQLEQSIEFDCRPGRERYTRLNGRTKPLTAEQWKQKQLERLTYDISYHTKENGKELNHTNERNKWLKQLWDSLEGVD